MPTPGPSRLDSILYNLVTYPIILRPARPAAPLIAGSTVGQGTAFRTIMPKAARCGFQTGDQTSNGTPMAEQDDVLYLIEDAGTAPEASTARKWKIAVIDDDPAIHEGT